MGREAVAHFAKMQMLPCPLVLPSENVSEGAVGDGCSVSGILVEMMFSGSLFIHSSAILGLLTSAKQPFIC